MDPSNSYKMSSLLQTALREAKILARGLWGYESYLISLGLSSSSVKWGNDAHLPELLCFFYGMKHEEQFLQWW